MAFRADADGVVRGGLQDGGARVRSVLRSDDDSAPVDGGCDRTASRPVLPAASACTASSSGVLSAVGSTSGGRRVDDGPAGNSGADTAAGRRVDESVHRTRPIDRSAGHGATPFDHRYLGAASFVYRAGVHDAWHIGAALLRARRTGH